MSDHTPSRGISISEKDRAIREMAAKELYNRNLAHFGLKPTDIKEKTILDVGASTGIFGDLAARDGAEVVSIDIERPQNLEDIKEGSSKKIFGIDVEAMNIAKSLGLNNEPEFDFVLSHYSVPYTFVNDLQDSGGKWKTELTADQWHVELRKKIFRVLESIFNHLKINGKGIVYPLFLDMDSHDLNTLSWKGQKRDLREFNTAVHEALYDLQRKYEFQFNIQMENVPVAGESYNFTRLVINRIRK